MTRLELLFVGGCVAATIGAIVIALWFLSP